MSQIIRLRHLHAQWMKLSNHMTPTHPEAVSDVQLHAYPDNWYCHMNVSARRPVNTRAQNALKACLDLLTTLSGNKRQDHCPSSSLVYEVYAKLTSTQHVWDRQIPFKVVLKTTLTLGYTLIPGTHTVTLP